MGARAPMRARTTRWAVCESTTRHTCNSWNKHTNKPSGGRRGLSLLSIPFSCSHAHRTTAHTKATCGIMCRTEKELEELRIKYDAEATVLESPHRSPRRRSSHMGAVASPARRWPSQKESDAGIDSPLNQSLRSEDQAPEALQAQLRDAEYQNAVLQCQFILHTTIDLAS